MSTIDRAPIDRAAFDRDVAAAVVAARHAQQVWLARAIRRAPGAAARLIVRLFAGWRREIARETARRRLEALDDRLLADMGLLRGTLDSQLRAAEADRQRARPDAAPPVAAGRPANEDSRPHDPARRAA